MSVVGVGVLGSDGYVYGSQGSQKREMGRKEGERERTTRRKSPKDLDFGFLLLLPICE